ncbi:MAG: hypothetical protein EBS01_02860 [Verrucomicrobia bacterium]|nr:hypothetical protein [Verrucomicrobiota bacterium]
MHTKKDAHETVTKRPSPPKQARTLPLHCCNTPLPVSSQQQISAKKCQPVDSLPGGLRRRGFTGIAHRLRELRKRRSTAHTWEHASAERPVRLETSGRPTLLFKRANFSKTRAISAQRSTALRDPFFY